MTAQTQAYNDVMDGVGPTMPDNAEYMAAYGLYKAIQGENRCDSVEHHNYD